MIGIPTIIKQAQLAMVRLPEQIKEFESTLLHVQKQIDSLPSPWQEYLEKLTKELEAFGFKLLEQIEGYAAKLLQSAIVIAVIPFLIFFIF